MPNLLQMLTAFGLAAGAGTRATVPVLVLGLFHHSPYFELAQEWRWIAAPPVMVILGALLIIELWAISHPEIGEYAEWASYAPTLLSGFIAFAASMGQVDRDLMSLSASGILGATTAGLVRYAWHSVKHQAEPLFESSDSSRRYIAWTELGTASAVSTAALTVPFLAIAGVALWLVLAKTGLAILRPLRVCGFCGGPVDRRAILCPHCRHLVSSPKETGYS